SPRDPARRDNRPSRELRCTSSVRPAELIKPNREAGAGSRIRGASKLLMAAVAHGPVAGAPAGAEPRLLRLLRLPLDRRKRRALVRAVAERLALRAPAGAPPVALAGLDIDRERSPSADFRLCIHAGAPPASVASHASPQALASSRTRRI